MPENKPNINDFELRSEEFQEILGHVPNWLTRWGTSLILCIIIIILIGSWFFKYPDVITSTITVTTEKPPSHLIARGTGKIQKLFVNDKDMVGPGDSIAIIENPANYNHVFILKEELTNYKQFKDKTGDSSSIFNENLDLGELQPLYNTFLKQLKEYKNFYALNYHAKKISSLKEELAKYKVYYNGLKRQEQTLKRELSLVKKQFLRDSALYKSKVISEADFEKSESILLQKKYSYEQASISLTSTNITSSKINQNILDLELDYSEKDNNFQLQLSEAYDNLQAQLAAWEQQYVLKSPINGTVTFNNIWSENQNIKAGETAFSIIPENAGEIIGKIKLQLDRSGKVKTGQRVNIKFVSFPFMEYGMVKGYIKSISLVPENNYYAVEVELPDQLKTFYGTELKFSQEMLGQAEIITEDIRLLQKTIDPIKYLFKKNIDN